MHAMNMNTMFELQEPEFNWGAALNTAVALAKQEMAHKPAVAPCPTNLALPIVEYVDRGTHACSYCSLQL